MSQEATSADFAADELDEQLTPPSDSESASGQPSYADAIGRSLLESLGVTDDDPADPDEPEPQPSDESADATPAERTASAAATLSPEDQMARWVDQLLANPKDITRIPQKQQSAVMEQYIARKDAMASQTAQNELQRVAAERDQYLGALQAQQRQVQAGQVAEINQLKADDPAGYVTWRDMFPDRAEVYDAFLKAERNPQAAQQQQTMAAFQATATQSAAAALHEELSQYPAAMQRLEAKLAADPSLYQPNPTGLRQFTADAAREIAAEQVAAQSKKEEPARQALAQKQANSAALRATPKPDVSSGQRGADPLTDDVDELLGMGFANAFKGELRRTAESVR